MFDLHGLTDQINAFMVGRCSAFDHDLDLLGRLCSQVTNSWVEPEFLFVTCVPSELDVLVAVVDNLEGDCLGFANDAVTNSEFVLQVIG